MKMRKKYMGGGMNKPRMTYRVGGLSKAQSREMDKDNDGDIDAQDLAMLRKAEKGMKMKYGKGGKNKMYSMEEGGEMMKRTGFMEMGSKMPKFKMREDDTMDALIIMQEGGVPLKKKTIPQEGAEMPERERTGTAEIPGRVAETVETRDKNAEERQKNIDLLEKFAQEYREEFEDFIKKVNETDKRGAPDISMYDPMRGGM
tara:strand:+ start:717 stop:1319 length:603 start_codon:yes stop_codon:yes gene_type:complete